MYLHEMFRIQTCYNHILSAAEGFRGQDAMSSKRDYIYHSPASNHNCQALICHDALVFRTFDTCEKHSSWKWQYLQFSFFSLRNIQHLNSVSRIISVTGLYNFKTYSSSESATLLFKGTEPT